MHNKVAVLSVALLAVSAQLVAAQPGAEPPPPGSTPATVIIIEPNAQQVAPAPARPGVVPVQPAPQNERWEDVSHINGQLVPVGSRNEYLYRFRRTNLAINPVGWLIDVYAVSASVAMNEHVALRGDFAIMGDDGLDIGITAPIYFRRTYQGPFVEPGLLIRNTGEDYSSGAGPQVLIGWHWMYDSGLNLAFAFGAGRNVTSSSDDEFGESEDAIMPNGYLRVGIAF